MKKIVALTFALIVGGAVPMLGHADPPQTDTQCAGNLDPVTLRLPGPYVGSGEIDRGSGCISDGNSSNGAELYVGGELNANNGGGTIGGSKPFGGPCGGIEVMGIQEELNVNDGFPMGYDNWGGGDCQ
jgi:hypothetical protein